MARSTPNLLTQAEYARHRKALGLPGSSRVAVHKAVNEGRISLIGDKIDPAVADIQWSQNTRARFSPEASAPAQAAPGAAGDLVAQAAMDTPAPTSAPADPPAAAAADNGYASARTRREMAEAARAEREEATARGAMVMREDVDRAMYEIGREVRDRLASCARRVAAEVSSLTSAEACEEVIDREHRIVLELLVTTFREKMGAPAESAA